MKRVALLAVCLLSLGPVGGATRAATARSSTRPDILLITIDTLRADHLSSYGYPGPITPNLDHLLSRGVRFSDAHTPEPLTHPSMAAMITSMHPHQHGATRNGLRLHAGLHSLPKVLARQGYDTAAFVSNWTLKPKVSGLDEHFATYRPVLTRRRWFGLVRSEAVASDLTDEALSWLEDREEDGRPVFLWVHYTDPHAPYKFHHEEGLRLGVSGDNKADRYATEVAFTDRAVGDLLAGFRAQREGDDALILFCADHGESLGENGYWGHGRHLYETELQIPMGIIWPDHFEPAAIDAPASILDLAPTILGLLGLDSPDSFAGYDWSSVLRGADPPGGRVTRHQAHRGAVMVHHESARARRKGLLAVALVAGGHKEVFRLKPRELRLSRVGLVASSSSPIGTDATEPGDRLSAWLSEVQDALAARKPVDQPLDEEALEKLRSLGYVD